MRGTSDNANSKGSFHFFATPLLHRLDSHLPHPAQPLCLDTSGTQKLDAINPERYRRKGLLSNSRRSHPLILLSLFRLFSSPALPIQKRYGFRCEAGQSSSPPPLRLKPSFFPLQTFLHLLFLFHALFPSLLTVLFLHRQALHPLSVDMGVFGAFNLAIPC